MMNAKKQLQDKTQPPLNHQSQAEAKDNETGQNKGDKVTNEDGKGKKTDADLSKIEDQPPE